MFPVAWLIGGAVAVAAKVVYDEVTDNSSSSNSDYSDYRETKREADRDNARNEARVKKEAAYSQAVLEVETLLKQHGLEDVAAEEFFIDEHGVKPLGGGGIFSSLHIFDEASMTLSSSKLEHYLLEHSAEIKSLNKKSKKLTRSLHKASSLLEENNMQTSFINKLLNEHKS